MIGLGALSEGEGAIFPDKLQEVIVTRVDMNDCAGAYANVGINFVKESIMFCASQPGKDACQGDSGLLHNFFPRDEDHYRATNLMCHTV